MVNLTAVTDIHLRAALGAPNGRSAELVVRDGELRQSVIGLAAGTELAEHNAPHAATILVLRGRVRVSDARGGSDVAEGVLHVLTHERHAVLALEDSAFLLTTVTGLPYNAEPPARM